MGRNPDWTRDELILALDLYFRGGRKWLPYTHPDVITLSDLLNTLPIHEPNIRDNDFRNPRGVSMKLANFLSLDPQYQGAGLNRRSKLDKDVWDEFAHDIYRLSQTAVSIANSTGQIADSGASYELDDADEEFPEGRILTRLHKRKERNRKVVEQKKQRVLRATGRLVCEVCDFDFARVYGRLGYRFAECHHTVPIAQLDEHHRTRSADLAIVCANCHRMIHRSRPMLSIQELRTLEQQMSHD
jgi:5-methylcytosine-specific restriction enzyme A